MRELTPAERALLEEQFGDEVYDMSDDQMVELLDALDSLEDDDDLDEILERMLQGDDLLDYDDEFDEDGEGEWL